MQTATAIKFMGPKNLIQSTDKSSILIEHETALVEHKEKMNSEANWVAKVGSANITFKTVDQEWTPAPGPRPSGLIQLIPANRVDVETLTQNVDKILDGKYFLCRTIAPAYRSCSINAVVDDPRGQQGIRLRVYNYSSLDNLSYDAVLEELPVGQILAVKNPYFKSAQNGGLFLQCDSPEAVVFISESGVKWEGDIPEKWQKFIRSTPKTAVDWKNQGNREFVYQKHHKAIQSYTEGLNLKDDAGADTSEQITCDLLSNRAAAYLKWDSFNSALEDVEKVLEIEPSHSKALYRKGKALLGLQRFQEAIQFLELTSNMGNSDSETHKLFTELLDLAQNLLQQQMTGEYDIVKLYKAREVRHEDCADFLGPVKVQKISGNRNGRGLVATQDIQPGQLISATKAFHITFPLQEQGPCSNVAVFGNSAAQFVNNPRIDFQQMLVLRVAQRLKYEPNLRPTFYQLYAGPDFPIYEAEKDSNSMMVDMERIESICRYNALVGNMPNFGLVKCAFVTDEALGIWILPSLINHSCWDINALWMTFGDMLFVRAIKEIPQGEEILISYVDPSQLYEEREKFLKARGILCECRLCRIDCDDSKEGQKRMELLKKIEMNRNDEPGPQSQMELEVMMKKLSDLDKGGQKPNLKFNPSLIHPLDRLGGIYFRYQKYKKCVDLMIKRHALSTNSSLKQLAVDSGFRIITLYLMDGKLEEAKKWTETLKKEILILYGTLDLVKLMDKEESLDLMAKFNIFLE